MEIITVKISDMQTACPPQKLATYALGSCVGICIYDALVKKGALGHIMLPGDGEIDKNTPHKYACTCIPIMVDELVKMGCARSNMIAKIAGGASLVQFSKSSNLSNIGERNVQAVKQALKSCGVRIAAEDTGKDYARTIFFNVENGEVEVKTYGKGTYKI